MADMLDRNEKHLFLEKYDNTKNSFIANVNLLVAKLDMLEQLHVKLTPEQIQILTQLADIGAETLAYDLEKGSEGGYRKLDIDLLKNFHNYEYGMSDEEKRELWNTPEAQVYYESVTVMFKDATSIFKTFNIAGVDTPVNNHHKLYEQFNDWPEFKAKYGYTQFNIVPDGIVHNHELLRFIDGQGNGSKIDYIVLHVASQGQNLSYDASFQGAKQHDPKYTWVDTTSVLLTICNDLSSILNIADNMNDLRLLHKYLSDLTNLAGNLPALIDSPNSILNNLEKINTIFTNMNMIVDVSKYVDEFKEIQENVNTTHEQVTADKEEIQNIADNIKTISNEIKHLEATASTLSSEQDATASYDSFTGILTIGVPRGPIGPKGQDGKDGRDGIDGINGNDGLPPDHRWVGTSLQFRNADGTWGPLIDLYSNSDDVLQIAEVAKNQVQIMEQLIQEAGVMKFLDDYGYITEEVEETFDYGHLTD